MPKTAVAGGRFPINYAVKLPEFDTAGAVAYAAHDAEDSAHHVYALIGHSGVPLRHNVFEAQRLNNISRIVSAEASEILPRFDGDGAGLVLIMHRPEGGVIEWDPDDTSMRIAETKVRKVLLPQILDGLESLADLDLTHRRINPRNIFYDDKDKTSIILGECVSEAPGASQPVMFEPIGRSMASPNGRGDGLPPDDVYALGVTIYCLLRGGRPAKKLTDAEFNQSRFLAGTWAALGADNGIPTGLVSLLRGMLNDDPEARWTAQEARLWLDGTAPRPRSGRKVGQVPSTLIEYAGHKVPTSKALAFLLAEKSANGARRIREKDFVSWVTNGLRDAPDRKKLQKIVDRYKAAGKNRSATDIFLLARVCRLLDPEGPIQLGQLAFFVDGLGPLLAAAFKNDKKGDLNDIEVGVGGGLLIDAVEQNDATVSRRLRLDAIKVQEYVNQNTLGLGLERALYDLCPSLPCQSPVVERYFATDLLELATALESAAGKGQLPSRLIDRHMAAFLGKQSGALEPQLEALRKAGDIPSSIALGTLDVLEAVQRRYAPIPMPALTIWMCGELSRVIDLLRSKKRRDLMTEKLSSVVSSGSLTEVSRTMDFPSTLKRDENEYQDTVIEFANNEILLRKLRQKVSMHDQLARAAGYGGVAAIGMIVWALVVVFFAFGGRE